MYSARKLTLAEELSSGHDPRGDAVVHIRKIPPSQGGFAGHGADQIYVPLLWKQPTMEVRQEWLKLLTKTSRCMFYHHLILHLGQLMRLWSRRRSAKAQARLCHLFCYGSVKKICVNPDFCIKHLLSMCAFSNHRSLI